MGLPSPAMFRRTELKVGEKRLVPVKCLCCIRGEQIGKEVLSHIKVKESIIDCPIKGI